MSHYRKNLNMILSALFLAFAFVFPFLTGHIPKIGSMLCPMHLPVLLCGFLCGWRWGAVVGFTAPLFRSLTLGAPLLFPMAICMALELATYGAVVGILFRVLPRKAPYVYVSLLLAMLSGRFVFGAAMFICLGIQGRQYTFAAFFSGVFASAVPGIILQIVLIPLLVILLDKKLLNRGIENE